MTGTGATDKGATDKGATGAARSLAGYATRTLRRGVDLFWTLARVMVPVFVIVRVAELMGLVEAAGALAGPLMVPVGLPPETALAFVACVLVGLPAGIAALAVVAEPITVAQASTLATMMLIAHALPIESAIVARAANAAGDGRGFWREFAINAAFRLGWAYAFGVLAHAVLAATGWLADPVDLSHLSGGEGVPGWGAWALASLGLLLTILLIILALLVLLDVMERIGVTALFVRAMRPVLRLAGLTDRTTPLVTIGMLLGLTYGAGLIIREVEDGGVPPGPRAMALAWLSLSHSVIEDTGLMLVIGASAWVTLVARIAFTLVVIRCVAWLATAMGRDLAPDAPA